MKIQRKHNTSNILAKDVLPGHVFRWFTSPDKFYIKCSSGGCVNLDNGEYNAPFAWTGYVQVFDATLVIEENL